MKRIFFLFFLVAVTLDGYSQNPPHLTIVKPNVIDDVLYNPGIGFTTFQRFNGDTGGAIVNCGDFHNDYPNPPLRDAGGNFRNPDYPYTTVAYLRWYWIFIEPEQGKYRWDIIDRALETARERGQTLMMSLMPYGSSLASNDVPAWYREMVGSETQFKHDNPVNQWLVDPEDPRYLEHYGRLIRTFGERYDGHPDVESVDIRIVGAWGEGGGTGLLKKETARALIDLYLESFKKTPIKLLLTDQFSNQYAISKADVGYRADCLGDLGFWADEQHGWTHMYDYYPEGIIEYGVRDAWKKSHVSFEMCGTFPSWKRAQGYTAEDVKYIFDQALKWHVSTFNGKSTAIPEEYLPQVEEFLKKMGYRFALRRLSYPTEVSPDEKVNFTTWWENQGVAPVYRPYIFAIRLDNGTYKRTFHTDANVKEWLPGDNVYNDSFFMPHDIPAGEYNVQIALLDNHTHEPVINLAIEGKRQDGWYDMGKIRVKGIYFPQETATGKKLFQRSRNR
jgi:hypothetical protein